MKKNILLPTDFSDNAWSAAVYAFKLYAEEEATFYFLNSVAISHGETRTYITSRYIDTMKKGAQKELKELKAQAEIANNNPKHTIQILISTDDLTTSIKNIIGIHSIDLVVMGTKGASGVDKFFLGSNTVKIIQSSKSCPILTVPEDYEFTSPKHIAFPTDFKRFYDHKELKPLLDFAEINNAHIYVLHINQEKKLSEEQDYNMTSLQNYLKNHQYSFHWMPDYTKKTEVINEFIKDLHIDVLAMINYKHSIIETITKEPVIKTIGYHPIVPFLVLPE